MNPLAGTLKDNPTEEETVIQAAQQPSRIKQPLKTTETKKVETKKTAQKNTKKKPAAVAPIHKMVVPYTTQQFFDQKADISNGQLLAMVPKFGLTIAKQLRKPIQRQKDEEPEKKPTQNQPNEDTTEDKGNPEVEDLMQVNTSSPNDNRTSALYCEASINHIRFPLIVDSGSAGSIISLALLKDLDMEITRASKTVMVNVNGERRRPLGAVSDIPLKIHECIIPMDAIVTEADSYAAIVGNDWLRKTKAIIDYDANTMVIKWKNRVLRVKTGCQEMPQHIVSIEVPEIEDEPAAGEQTEEEAEEVDEESEEEYDSEDDVQEQMYCQAQFITKEEAQQIETDLKEDNFIENKYFYQYEETEREKFHTGKLNESQQQEFQEFMKNYQDLFAWEPDDFGCTSVVSHRIDTGDATPIKQRFYRTSYQNQLFIKEEIQRLLEMGLIKPSMSQWTSPVVVVEKKNGKK